MPDVIEGARSGALLQLGRQLKESGYRFTTVTPATHERVNSRPGNDRARNLTDVFGWSRAFEASCIPVRIMELMRQTGIVIDAPNGMMRSAVRASTLGEDLLFHSAFPTAEADSVFFGPDSYRFADAIRMHFLSGRGQVRRAIEICCGAAPGAVTIARQFPTAEVLATDINRHALELAAVNGKLAGMALEARYGNLLRDVDGGFDLIAANPPYLIDPDLRAYRHGGGQYGAGLSLDILSASIPRLNHGGTLLLYTGSAIVEGRDLFREAAQEILASSDAQWRYREIDPDVFGEELERPAYREADRLAAVMLEVTAAP